MTLYRQDSWHSSAFDLRLLVLFSTFFFPAPAKNSKVQLVQKSEGVKAWRVYVSVPTASQSHQRRAEVCQRFLVKSINLPTYTRHTHTVLVACYECFFSLLFFVFLTWSSGSRRHCETPHVRQKHVGISMPCLADMWLHLLEMEKSSPVSTEEVQFPQ